MGLGVWAGGCVMVQAEAPEACVVAEGIEVSANSTLDSSTHTIVEDKLDEMLPDGVSTEVEFHEVILAVAQGAPDLDFVDTAQIAMRAADSHAFEIELVGDILQDTWRLDAEVCFGVTAECEVQLY